MSSSVGVFYAFAKNINDDVTYRYLITFSSRGVANEWYRAVTDSVAGGYQRFAAVKRVSPQWYTHNPGAGNIPDTITDPKVANMFLNRVFFTLLNDRDGRIISTIPVLNYADHVNGAIFSIRSVSRPDTYWFYDSKRKSIIASCNCQRRTRFMITNADSVRAPGSVIIKSDDVYITAIPDNVNVGVTSSTDQLGYSANPFPFEFSSFETDFMTSPVYYDGDASLEQVIRNPGKGERWELV